jgi:hypothetical protein
MRGAFYLRGIAICDVASTPAGEHPPLADIAVNLDSGDVLSLMVVDRATDKRLARSIPLRSIPQDARALSIAVAAEELLHASWLEALMDHDLSARGAPPVSAPPVIERIAVASLSPRARAPRDEGAVLDLVSAGEHAAGGQSLGGFDARASYGSRFGVRVRLGYRLGLVATAEHGDVQSNAVVGGVALTWSFTSSRAAPWGAELFSRADAVLVTFSGRASDGASASSGEGVAVLTGGGIGGWRSLGQSGEWRLVGELSLAATLRGVGAVDDDRQVISLTGAVVGVAVGIGAAL